MRAFFILVLLAGLLVAIYRELIPDQQQPNAVAELLGEVSPPPGFDYALAPRPLNFPSDHGAHPTYRSEWWYFTGNLRDPHQRAFGFQFTLFRFALTPNASNLDNPWRASQIYLGQLAISDVAERTFHSHERQARGALDLSGASNNPVRIWLRNWTIEQTDPANEIWQITAKAGDNSIALQLKADRDIVLQGEDGLSRKSERAGNASYYYSIPRMTVDGRLTVEGSQRTVTGRAWFDHEWSTSALADDEAGWDWFSLQFDDGSELMYYRIRRKSGHTDGATHGVYLHPDGRRTALGRDNVKLVATGRWRSPRSGAVYPSGWRLTIDDLAITITVSPKFRDQEWHRNFTYWEGAVTVDGQLQNRPITGEGYVELVGYER